MIEVILDALLTRWQRRGHQSHIRDRQADNVIVGSLRAIEVKDWRFGDIWLSGEWHVLPGSVRLGSTTVKVDRINDVVEHGTSGKYLLAPGLDATVLTLHGPRGIVEMAMAATSEEWFREAVSARL